MHRFLFITNVLASSALGCPGAAAAARPFQIENWSGAAYFNDQSKQFERCSASRKAANGAAMSYSIDRNLRWSLSISNENWSLYPGLALNVALKLDERTLQARGAGIGKDGFEVQVEDDIALFSSLQTA